MIYRSLTLSQGRWMATASLYRFESRHLSKIQWGDIKQKSGQHTLARQKVPFESNSITSVIMIDIIQYKKILIKFVNM